MLRKFWTVRESRKASLDNFSASISVSPQAIDVCLISNAGTRLEADVAVSSLRNVNFSGLISVDDLFFGARRLKLSKISFFFFFHVKTNFSTHNVKSMNVL